MPFAAVVSVVGLIKDARKGWALAGLLLSVSPVLFGVVSAVLAC